MGAAKIHRVELRRNTPLDGALWPAEVLYDFWLSSARLRESHPVKNTNSERAQEHLSSRALTAVFRTELMRVFPISGNERAPVVSA